MLVVVLRGTSPPIRAYVPSSETVSAAPSSLLAGTQKGWYRRAGGRPAVGAAVIRFDHRDMYTDEHSHGPESGTQSAIRVADVLLALAGGPERLGVTAIARELGLSKAVVHRILQSLLARHLVTVDPVTGTYALGAAAAALGARAMRDLDLRRTALPVLRRLQVETAETTTISALIGDRRVYLDQIVSVQRIRMEVELGLPFPLHAGSSSKAILAVAPPDLRQHILEAALTRLTAHTIVDPDALLLELEEIGRTGVAVSRGERQSGAGSVAAAVFGLDGWVVGAISVCGPITRFNDAAVERFVPLVRDAAEEISRGMRSAQVVTTPSPGHAFDLATPSTSAPTDP